MNWSLSHTLLPLSCCCWVTSVVSNSVWPHRRQPTRLPHHGGQREELCPWHLGFSRQEHWSGLPFPSPMHESKNEREVSQSCPTLSDPMDCSLPGSSVHGIFQARVLEWGAIALSVPHFYLPTKMNSSNFPSVGFNFNSFPSPNSLTTNLATSHTLGSNTQKVPGWFFS